MLVSFGADESKASLMIGLTSDVVSVWEYYSAGSMICPRLSSISAPNPYLRPGALIAHITHTYTRPGESSLWHWFCKLQHTGLIIDSIKKVQLPQQIDPSYNIIISTSTMAIIGHSQAEPRIMGKENEVTLYKRTSISDALGGVNSPGVSSMEIKE